MAFDIKRRGKLTYYYRAGRPVFSFVVTEALPDGDLRVYLAGLTGGESATRNLGLSDTATMDPDKEIPRVFQTWESWLKEAGVCGSIQELDFIEMHAFGCQPKRRLRSKATLTHEEHGAVEVPAGCYRVQIHDEWSDSLEARRVLD